MNLYTLLGLTDRAQLLKHTYTKGELQSIQVTSITDDSRQAGLGVLFCATKNGRKFIEESAAAGSILLLPNGWKVDDLYENKILRCASPDRMMGRLSSAFEGDPSKDLKIVAVTGTNGKTTTTHMLFYLWKQLRKPCALIGTLGVKIFNGSQETTWQTGFTTPRSYELHSILRQFVEQGISLVAIEASSEALSLGRLEGVSFSCILFTGLGRDHLNYHQTIDRYMRAKRHLFFLKWRKNRSAPAFVFAGDLEEEMIQTQEEKLVENLLSRFVSKSNQSIVWLMGAQINSIAAQNQPVPTFFNRVNAALALQGLSTTIGKSDWNQPMLAGFEGVPGRMQRIKVNDLLDVFIDYAHSPDSLQRVLSEIKLIGYDCSVVVFGCGGDRDKGKRALMGQIAAQLADLIFITDDNPRTEDANQIRLEILSGIQMIQSGSGGNSQYNKFTKFDIVESQPIENATTAKKEWLADFHERKAHLIFNIGDRKIAIKNALQLADSVATSTSARTAVIIAGKGHETYQIIGKTKHHFSDVEIVREYLEGLGKI